MITFSMSETKRLEELLSSLTVKYVEILERSPFLKLVSSAKVKEKGASGVTEKVEDMHESHAANVRVLKEPVKNELGVLIDFGGVHGRLIGGPYRDRPGTMPGIKMAEEIHLPCVVDIPTRDFNVPDVSVLLLGMASTAMVLQRFPAVYVGCAGGIGRTGLFMASMVKLMAEVHKAEVDPITYVRAVYNPKAVETAEQEDFIRDLDVRRLAAAVNCIK